MNARGPFRYPAIVAGLLLLAACGDRTVTEPVPPESMLAFAFRGERSGSFQARGDVRLDTERRPLHGTWAAALQVPGDALAVTAARAHDAPHSDVVLIALQNVTAPGTVRIDATCGADPLDVCSAGMFAIRYNWHDGSRPPEASYFLVSGTVHVTSITALRIRGTFRGTAAHRAGGPEVLIVEQGEFDVPVTAAQPLQRSLLPAGGAGALRSILGRFSEP